MSSNKPIFGSQLAGDVLEGLKDQSDNTVSALQDLVKGPAIKSDSSGVNDSGIEQLGGSKTDDPQKQLQQAQNQGLNPQQLAEKREEEKKKIEFFREQTQSWDEHYKEMKKEEEMKEEKEEEEKKRIKDQEIIELREEEAKAATLNPQKVGPKPGRGTALMPVQKQYQGTGELQRTPTN